MTSFDRKQNSETLLQSLGITLIDHLPPIEEESAVTLRSAQEVAERIMILTYLNCAASDPSQRPQMMMFLIHEKLWDKTSEEEKILFQKAMLTEDDLSIMLWRTESIWLLLWVINKVDSLHLPQNEAGPNDIFPILPGFFQPTGDFIHQATIRNISEIMDQGDFIFRLNWALRENNTQALDILLLLPNITYERYFAINWVIRTRESWDGSL